jgi:hypothetical protein
LADWRLFAILLLLLFILARASDEGETAQQTREMVVPKIPLSAVDSFPAVDATRANVRNVGEAKCCGRS